MFIFAKLAKLAYTKEQMIGDKDIIATQATRLYDQAVLEWNGFDEANQTWPELKSHFDESTLHLPEVLYLLHYQRGRR